MWRVTGRRPFLSRHATPAASVSVRSTWGFSEPTAEARLRVQVPGIRHRGERRALSHVSHRPRSSEKTRAATWSCGSRSRRRGRQGSPVRTSTGRDAATARGTMFANTAFCATSAFLVLAGRAAEAQPYSMGPPPGRLIDVGGYQLHIRCIGEGASTVVIDGGAGAWSIHRAHVQRAAHEAMRDAVPLTSVAATYRLAQHIEGRRHLCAEHRRLPVRRQIVEQQDERKPLILGPAIVAAA